jgi:hypothetical protein
MFWIKAGGLSTLVYFAPSITQQVGPRSTITDTDTDTDTDIDEPEPQLCA